MPNHNLKEFYSIGDTVKDAGDGRSGQVVKVTKSSLTVKYKYSKVRYNPHNLDGFKNTIKRLTQTDFIPF